MDPIKRKLAAIDKELAGTGLSGRLVVSSPLVFAAAGLIVGIMLQQALADPQAGAGTGSVWLWVGPALVLTAVAVALYVAGATGRSDGHGRAGLACCLSLCFASLGGIRLLSFKRLPADDIAKVLGEQRSLATIRGIIATRPRIEKRPDWQFARFKPTDPPTSFYLELTQLQSLSGWAPVTGTVRVQVDEPVLDLDAGDCIQAYCWLERFKPASNPGQFDFARWLARRNIFVAATVKTREGIQLHPSPPAALPAKLRRTIRNIVARGLLGAMDDSGPARGLLEALLLGYRGNIDSRTHRAFCVTGLLHFVSLSGLHFGILMGIVWWLCKTAGLLRRGRALVCALAIGGFLSVVPARAPTLRAAVIGWVFCASLLFRRRPNPLNTLSLAAIVLLLIRPTQLFEAGWQLSFATVLGILVLEGRIERKVRETVEDLCANLDYRRYWRSARLLSKAARVLVPLFAVGLAAWIGAAGILLYHFGTITPLASVWTVLVFPLVAVVLGLGFLKILVFHLLPTLGWILGVAAAWASELLVWAVVLLSRLDFSQVLIGRVPLWPVLLYYAAVILAVAGRFRRSLLHRALVAGLVVIVLLPLAALKWRRLGHRDLVMTCLDVGHGQAILVQFPGGSNALFDAGSLNVSDVGTRVVGPALHHEGIGRLEAVFVSHNDLDHLNGIPEVASQCRIGQVCVNQAFFDQALDWGTARYLEECLGRIGLDVRSEPTRPDLAGPARLESFWPPAATSGTEQLSDNDRSQVWLVEFAGRRILLCSDIERYAQRRILDLYPRLRADVVVAPHHGSVTTAEPGFIEKLAPQILVCSCDRRTYQRHCQARTDDQVEVFYTARDGAVTIRIGQDGGLSVSTYLQPN